MNQEDFSFKSCRCSELRFLMPIQDVSEEYQIISQEFLRNILVGVSKRCLAFDNEKYGIFDMPYTYNERVMDSVVLPTLAQLCDGLVMTELPVSRERNRSNSRVNTESARLDYWCIYKDYTFAIEMKHSYDGYRTPHVRERKIVDRWEELTKLQLGSLGKEIRKTWGESTKGKIRLGLHFITSYSDRSPISEQEICRDFALKCKERMTLIAKEMNRDKRIETRPDFAGAWLIDSTIIEKDEFCTFPALMLFGKVMSPIK